MEVTRYNLTARVIYLGEVRTPQTPQGTWLVYISPSELDEWIAYCVFNHKVSKFNLKAVLRKVNREGDRFLRTCAYVGEPWMNVVDEPYALAQEQYAGIRIIEHASYTELDELDIAGIRALREKHKAEVIQEIVGVDPTNRQN